MVSVEWDSEDWLSILTPTLLLNFFTQVEPMEQEPRNEHSATTASESSRTKPTKTRYGASRLVGNSDSNKPIAQPVQQTPRRLTEQQAASPAPTEDVNNLTDDELKRRIKQLLDEDPSGNEFQRLIGILKKRQEDVNFPTVTTEKIPLGDVEHIDLDAHVKSTGEVEQTEYQPLPTKDSIEQSLEKHGLINDCWLRSTFISTLEQRFHQLPANLDPRGSR